MATAEKQDRLGLRVEKVDGPRAAGNDDPSPCLKLLIHVGPESPIPAASLEPVDVASGSSVLEPAIRDHPHVCLIAERMAERPAQFQPRSRYDNDEGLLGVPPGDFRIRVTLHTRPPCWRPQLTRALLRTKLFRTRSDRCGTD